MKILTQDRKRLTEVSKELWETRYDGETYAILNHGNFQGYLGLYESESRAKEIILDIYDNLNENKATFKMPEN